MRRTAYHATDYDGTRPLFFRAFRRRRTLWQIITNFLRL